MPESYRLAQADFRRQVREQWEPREPLLGPIALYLQLHGEGRGDADNLAGAAMDAAGPSKKEAGIVWQDDRVSVIPILLVDWHKTKKEESRWLIHIVKLSHNLL